MKKLLLATYNKGKLREYRRLLRGIPFEIITPSDCDITAEIPETGATFEENAIQKATTMAALSNLLTLADDSGLEVEALGGAPGSLSHRFAGKNADDAKRIDYLLSKLKAAPDKNRAAQFRCVIAIAEPAGKVEICCGSCRGVIIDKPRGTNGFGYDPIFFIPELGKTMAELTMTQKNKISHRARAAEKARDILIDM
jgi:XTP/dITP diphosphohydrolase